MHPHNTSTHHTHTHMHTHAHERKSVPTDPVAAAEAGAVAADEGAGTEAGDASCWSEVILASMTWRAATRVSRTNPERTGTQ